MNQSSNKIDLPMAAALPLPVKALITMIIFTMGIAMVGAAGQIIVHDIIPTFFSDQKKGETGMTHAGHTSSSEAVEKTPIENDTHITDDLFAGEVVEEKRPKKPFYKEEQFVWLLKWTHIHLFGMNMIFVFMGCITLLLNMAPRGRTWLVVLPFLGVVMDIIAMWLKTYVSDGFFWLHVPSGGLFVGIFFFTATRALWEMWLCENKTTR